MNLDIRWKGIDKSDAVRSHVEEKLAKVYDFQFVGEDIRVELESYERDHTFKTGIVIQIHKSGPVRAEASAPDILTSINLAVDKVVDQLRRVKTKYNLNK